MDSYSDPEEEEYEREYMKETFKHSWEEYQFTYKVFQFETESSFSVTCTIKKSNKEIGNLKAWFIVDRSWSSNFYEDCDAISAELQLMSNVLFYSTGTLRKHEWSLNKEQIMNVSRGGFLSIEDIEIQKSHRGKDLAFRCIKKFFDYFSNRWSICAVMPWYHDNKYQEEVNLDPEETKKKQFNICRLFLRLGFLQIPMNSKYMYLLPENLKSLNKHEVQDVAIELQKPQQEPDPLNARLVRDLDENSKEEDILTKLRACQAEGLDLNNGCLHLAAHNGPVKLVEILIREGADINNKNNYLGDTPLHACCRGSVAQQVYKTLCTHASLEIEICNESGYTPYDIMIRHINGQSCFIQIFSLKPRLEEIKPSYNLALALMPNELKETLIEGLVSPRIFERLKVVAEIDSDMADFNPSDYPNGVKIDVDEIMNGSCFDCLPEEITAGGVFKSFVSGFNSILLSISVIVNYGQLPTKCRILRSLESSWPPNHVHFFEHGGRIEHLIKGLFHLIRENSFEYGDGDFEDMHGELLDALPMLPYFDEDYQYLNVVVYDYLINH